MKAKLRATLVGCNRVVGCLDWSQRSEHVAFGAHHFVAIYDTETAAVVGVLNGHNGQVNCVRWIDLKKGLDYLVSASADATLRVWKWADGHGECMAVLKDYASGVTVAAVHVLQRDCEDASVLIASCSSDPDVKIWKCTNGSDLRQWSLMTSLDMGSCIQQSAALASLPVDSNHLLLALGGTDAVVRLFLCLDGQSFHPACTLRGHEDWVRGLDIHTVSESKILLASASQDRFVRVWGMTSDAVMKHNPLTQLAPSLSFQAATQRFIVKLEGLLTGHEDWVHFVQFNSGHGRLRLLSTSMDRTMLLWEWDTENESWQQAESVGDAGCSSLGYFTGVFSPDGTSILAHGFTGALHLWKKASDGSGWLPKPVSTGHYDEVVDMCLAIPQQSTKEDPFTAILSVSKDQTTRISTVLNGRWCEIARPQVHGHDFHAVSSVPGRFPDCFVSCSEEKVIRVFAAPSSFHEYLSTNRVLTTLPKPSGDKTRPYGASIKALALTNTAIYDDQLENVTEISPQGVVDQYAPGPDFAPNANPTCITGAPLEEHLSQNTLWPEVRKLYGHGDVVYSLAASPCGRFVASACKAQKEDTAVIFVWETSSWTSFQQLRGHTLTVTRMEFSPSGKYLLSGSRDRTFCLFQSNGDAFQFKLRKAKAHARIIWDVSWASDEVHFATASRDQSIKIWKLPDASCVLRIPAEASVTAVAFQPQFLDMQINCLLLAAGQEDGEISIWKIKPSTTPPSYTTIWTTDIYNMHSAAVFKLLWTMARSLQQGSHHQTRILASCSADHSIRLFELN